MHYSGPGSDLPDLQCLRAELREGILAILLNRPVQGNTVNVALSLEMQSLLATVACDPTVRVVVLRGAGEGFCAGIDSQDFLQTSGRDDPTLRAAREASNHWRVRQLRQLPQPVIAMVHGFCKGGAIAILESCDIVLVADDAQFTLTESDTDLLADAALARAAASVMTPRAARYHALSGRAFDGREAERNGLASRSVSPAQLEQETNALARELADKDAIALQFTKETLQHVDSMSWDGVLSYTAAKFAELKALQAGRPSAREAAVEGFLAGKSKPGLGG
jgi:trans-feruloyl-CoA hydratase/vanillin synthase